MYRHYFRRRTEHETICLLVHWRVLVTCCCSGGLRALVRLHYAAFIGVMIKVCQVFVFTFVLLLFEIFKQFNGDIGALISVELYEMLHTIVNNLINLEKEICLVAQELSSHIFVLICVQNIAIGDGRQYGFDQVLESLVD